jgi:hypothetical protein
MAPAFDFSEYQEETTMTKLLFFSVLLVAAFATLAAPAFAQQKAAPTAGVYAQRDVCAGYEPGNPFSKQTSYWDWSAWRARGGWDARNDYKCISSHSVR